MLMPCAVIGQYSVLLAKCGVADGSFCSRFTVCADRPAGFSFFSLLYARPCTRSVRRLVLRSGVAPRCFVLVNASAFNGTVM